MKWMIVIILLLLLTISCSQDETDTPQDVRSQPGQLNAEVVEADMTFPVESSGYYPNYNILLGTSGEGKYPKLYHLDNHGNVLREWVLKDKFGAILGDRRILPNGHLLFIIGLEAVYEIDYDGNLVWTYIDSTVTHHAEQLPNGHILTAGAECDCVKEIDYSTKQVLWTWDAKTLFPDYQTEEGYIGSTDYPGARSAYATYTIESKVFPNDWSHINYVQWLPSTDTFMVSLRSFDLIMEINRVGEVLWTFGPGVIKHQHYPKVLPDDSILVYDNGNGRVLRVTRTHDIIWQYNGLYAPFLGDNDLLPDGNYKILQTTSYEANNNASDVRIVSPDKDTIWRLLIPGEHMYRAFFQPIGTN